MTQNNDSMAEGLKKLLPAISQLKVLPDADMQFLSALEMAVIGYLKQQAQKAAAGTAQAAAQAAGGAPSMGGGPQMGPPQPHAMAPGGAAGGGMGGLTQPPNPDELRRVLAGAGGPG